MKRKNASRKLAIKLEGVTKRYTLHHEKPTFSETLIKRQSREVFYALKDIDFTVQEGERVGIIGSNGSGKTTLLKVISGITTPNSGVVHTRGKVISIIDLEAGFHPDLTGEENIFLNGLVIGMSKDEIRKKMPAIVKFADIGNFLDTPLYSYSQGMKLRLGFSVAVHAEPDLLILDEGIQAGDERFQKKAAAKINQFFRAKKTILIVSHWLPFLRKYCQRIVWVDRGRIKLDGGVEVLDKYQHFAAKK